MRKISSGIFGLNALMDGGINAHSSTVVIGSSGAGKTTFATQFIRRGLEDGQEGIFITLDEPPDQIVQEARDMGWVDIDDYLDEDLLVFIDASGREFTKFVKEELADFVSDWEGADARIAIDPLTPVIWSVKDPADQRDLVSFFLRQCKKIGTVLCTLEEHGTLGTLSGPETIIPMYLSDNVIHLRYVSTNDLMNREIKVIKSRRSRHSNIYHPYQIIKGAGIVINEIKEPRSTRITADEEDLIAVFNRKIMEVEDSGLKIPKGLLRRMRMIIETVADENPNTFRAEEFIDLIFEEYNIKWPG